MVLFEALETKSQPCQIFATDLSESAIEKARTGIYGENSMAGVSPERTRRFFVKVEGGWQISRAIRDHCIFARQDLIKDPPFSRLDLITCRNVLIYMEHVVHRRLIPMFHYALRPGGYLFLGSTEAVGNNENLFRLVDKKHKIYQSTPNSRPPSFDLSLGRLPAAAEESPPPVLVPDPPKAREENLLRELDQYILHRFAPCGVVVNEDFEILQFRGQTGDYLRPASGKASHSLFRMAREGLLFDLRAALRRAVQKNKPVRTEPIAMGPDHPTGSVVIEVIPVVGTSSRQRQYLVLFQEQPLPVDGKRPPARRGRPARRDLPIHLLRQELEATKEHLQSIIETQETTNEELTSANEEILSANEELQSTNEELETAKEELQSTNEELTTLNEELQNRNVELVSINNDMLNLFVALNLPILMVGGDLRIRRFTPLSEKVFNMIAGDVGRPVTDLKPGFDIPNLGAVILESIESVATVEREVRDGKGKWQLLRVRPYRTPENRIDGAVILLLDIDDRKRMEEAGAVAEGLPDTVREAVAILDRDGLIRRANSAFLKMFRLTGAEGNRFRDLGLESIEPLVAGLLSGPQSTASGEARIGDRRFEVRGRRVDRQGSAVLILVLDEIRN